MRNSEQSVVQFSYGDDGLNPNVMEKGDRPVDFSRLTVNTCLKHIVASKKKILKNINVRILNIVCVLLVDMR